MKDLFVTILQLAASVTCSEALSWPLNIWQLDALIPRFSRYPAQSPNSQAQSSNYYGNVGHAGHHVPFAPFGTTTQRPQAIEIQYYTTPAPAPVTQTTPTFPTMPTFQTMPTFPSVSQKLPQNFGPKISPSSQTPLSTPSNLLAPQDSHSAASNVTPLPATSTAQAQGSSDTNPESASSTAATPVSKVPESVESKIAIDALDFLPKTYKYYILDQLSSSVTKLALEMDREIEASRAPENSLSRENIVFSPASIAGTMAMVHLGSAGITFEEIAKLLNLHSGIDASRHAEIIHRLYALMLHEASKDNFVPGNPEYNFAFATFVERGFPIREVFQKFSADIYKNEIVSLDFLHNRQEALWKINDWVRNHTNNKITKLLSEAPEPSTRVIFASALYFNGEWLNHFIDGATQKKAFFVEPEHVSSADIMANSGEFLYYEDKTVGAKIIRLPYKGEEVGMYVILPDKKGAKELANFKAQLTPQSIEYMVSNLQKQNCIVAFPKMNLSSTLKLRNVLQRLGLTSLFNETLADLSILSPGFEVTSQLPTNNVQYAPNGHNFTVEQQVNQQSYYSPYYSNGPIRFPSNQRRSRHTRSIKDEITKFLDTHDYPSYGIDALRNSNNKNPGLYAEEVVHKVEMTVNERGTEAAAATSTDINRIDDSKKFVANRPFLFFIRHDHSKLIWFWGTVNQP